MGRRAKGELIRRNRTWYLRYQQAGRQVWRSLKKTDKGAARAEQERIMAALALQDKAEVRRSLAHLAADAESDAANAPPFKTPFADAWQKYLDNPRRPQSGPLTLQDYQSLWGRFVRWAAGRRASVEDVTADDAAAFVRTLDKLSAHRYNLTLQLCSRMFRLLAPSRANPFADIARRRGQPQGRRELSEGELREVCAKASGELRTLLAVGLFTGARMHDAACLDWSAVNLPLNRLTLKPAKTFGRTGKTLVIPIHRSLRAILEETAPAARRGPVLPELAAMYERDRPALCRRIQRHFRACGIETTAKSGRCLVGFHSLRHSFVTLCAVAGVPLPVVQELVGHANPTIQRVYLHLGAEMMGRAVAMLPDVTDTAPKALPPPAVTVAADVQPAPDVAAMQAKLARIRAAVAGRTDETARAVQGILDGRTD